ncbi:MAG: DNA repair protein RecO [Gammaproteobacteria bacterium]|nr:DNA repair protein RecO [Gammaproteobacteria bacterium]
MSVVERVTLEPAFVLHARAYRESSDLLEVFGCHAGLVSLVARGVRRAGSRLRPLLQPFRPLQLSWSGRSGGLMTLTGAEADGAARELAGGLLLPAFYINELLLRFLHRGDPHPQIFAAYGQALGQLAEGMAAEPVLRLFEMRLLAETGYGLNLDHEALSGDPLEPDAGYQYLVEQGPVRVVQGAMGSAPVFSGADLLAMARGELDAASTLHSARRLLRLVLDHHLGGRPLRTRQVARAMRH